MKFVIYGAGGIGGTIGARLHMSGYAVTLIARGEHGAIIAERGLRLIAPDGDHHLQIPVVGHPRDVEFTADTCVLMCMKSHHMQSALVDLSLVAAAPPKIFCVQNGVANETVALRYFDQVYATVVNLPAMFLTPGEVVTHASGHGGILDTGRYPEGVDETTRDFTDALTAAGFSARPEAQIMRYKYAKLLLNLANAIQAVVADPENAMQLAGLAKKEALACFSAGQINCATRDEVRARASGVYQMADIPGHPRLAGSSWQSLARGNADVETEFLNGEIVLLGRQFGVPTPVNSLLVELTRRVVRDNAGPGSMSSADILRFVDLHSQDL